MSKDQMSTGRAGNEQKVGNLGGHEGVLVLELIISYKTLV